MKKKPKKKKKKYTFNMKNVCWGIGKLGGGNLDILRRAKKKIPAICNKHQEVFAKIIECNDCDVRIF